MQRPWIKICGMTRTEDIETALQLGARHVGCILNVPRSPRSVSVDSAARLASIAASRLVVVVQDMPIQDLRRAVDEIGPAVVQLHGEESSDFACALADRFPELTIWKALGLKKVVTDPGAELARCLDRIAQYQQAGAHGALLDARTSRGFGGSGTPCDWDLARRIVESSELPVVLAGGLNPENIVEAAQSVAPYGLDVSSGVEDAPGIKSHSKLQALFENWRAV